MAKQPEAQVKTVEELKQYFETELAEPVRKVDSRRKMIILKINIMFVIMAILMVISFVVLVVFLSADNIEYKLGWTAAILLIYPTLAWSLYRQLSSNKAFYNQFKWEVIHGLVKFIDTKLSYEPKKHMPTKLFNGSKIFPFVPVRYQGDDFVTGRFSQTEFKVRFSEILAEYKPKRPKDISPDKWKDGLRPLFKGIFFTAESELEFEPLFVLPKEAEFSYDRAGYKPDELQTIVHPNQRFSEYFRVLAVNPEDALEKLSDKVVNDILEFKATHPDDVYLGFIKNTINIAISHEKDLFEPHLRKSLLDFELIREYYEVIYPAFRMLEHLNEAIARQRKKAAKETAKY
jgi:hypothetical protein